MRTQLRNTDDHSPMQYFTLCCARNRMRKYGVIKCVECTTHTESFIARGNRCGREIIAQQHVVVVRIILNSQILFREEYVFYDTLFEHTHGDTCRICSKNIFLCELRRKQWRSIKRDRKAHVCICLILPFEILGHRVNNGDSIIRRCPPAIMCLACFYCTQVSFEEWCVTLRFRKCFDGKCGIHDGVFGKA